jgi:hypothetical protein
MFSTGVPEIFLIKSYRLKHPPGVNLKEFTFRRIAS